MTPAEDEFDRVMGSSRGADREEPGNVGKLVKWLNDHDPADEWGPRGATGYRRLGDAGGDLQRRPCRVFFGLERVGVERATTRARRRSGSRALLFTACTYYVRFWRFACSSRRNAASSVVMVR